MMTRTIDTTETAGFRRNLTVLILAQSLGAASGPIVISLGGLVVRISRLTPLWRPFRSASIILGLPLERCLPLGSCDNMGGAAVIFWAR